MNHRITRAVGFCQHSECDDYHKGVFLLNHGDTFYCPRCRRAGAQKKEIAHTVGIAPFYQEVRVEYDYDPAQERYKCLAIVRDNEMLGGNVYHLYSPLIKTEKRALKVAETILAQLLHCSEIGRGENSVPTTETTLDMGSPDYRQKLELLEATLKDSWLAREVPR